MSDPLAHGDDEREDLAPGERQMTSADLTAHDEEHGEVTRSGEPSPEEPAD